MINLRAWTTTISTGLIVGVVAASTALAEPVVTGADLLVDLDKFIGKEVILTNAEVYGAGNSGAFVSSGGATFRISVEGIDRETFRQFLKSCSGLSSAPECKGRLLVTPNGQKSTDAPILTNVKLVR